LFSEDVRDVVLKTPGGHPMSKQQFKLTKSEADEMRALAGMDDSTRSYIDAKSIPIVIKNIRYQLPRKACAQSQFSNRYDGSHEQC